MCGDKYLLKSRMWIEIDCELCPLFRIKLDFFKLQPDAL